MNFLHEAWTYVLAGISAVVWMVRLEGRANTNTRDLARLEQRLAEQRVEDMANRQRDRDEMKNELREMRSDIKEILQELRTR